MLQRWKVELFAAIGREDRAGVSMRVLECRAAAAVTWWRVRGDR
ncbi:hypothetical protein [Streptomyces sp. NPDC007929]